MFPCVPAIKYQTSIFLVEHSVASVAMFDSRRVIWLGGWEGLRTVPLALAVHTLSMMFCNIIIYHHIQLDTPATYLHVSSRIYRFTWNSDISQPWTVWTVPRPALGVSAKAATRIAKSPSWRPSFKPLATLWTLASVRAMAYHGVWWFLGCSRERKKLSWLVYNFNILQVDWWFYDVLLHRFISN